MIPAILFSSFWISLGWMLLNQCFFFHFEDFFLGRLENIFDILEDFLRAIIKNKRKIVLEARNTENFRLRRAKIVDFIVILVQNRQIWPKSRPNGAKKSGGRKYFSFLKSKKKHWVQLSRELYALVHFTVASAPPRQATNCSH